MKLIQKIEALIVDVRLPEFKASSVLRPDLEVQVEMPGRYGGKEIRWYKPDQSEPFFMRLLSRYQKDQWDERRIRKILVGRKIRIPELEAQLQTQGIKLSKRVK